MGRLGGSLARRLANPEAEVDGLETLLETAGSCLATGSVEWMECIWRLARP